MEQSEAGRRDVVLESALDTFTRFGYRKTSMEEVARQARISRPGLYFLFASKEALFREAVTRALELDLAAAEEILAATDRPLQRRLVDAFDQWTGRYLGPIKRDLAGVVDEHPELLGAIVETAPKRFEKLVTDAIAAVSGTESARQVAQTLISASVGLKYQVRTRSAYRKRLAVAVELLTGSL
ncbi:TetR/AcrR family transcriptional regulator [Kribbella italica]|uniref:AcrR family transcriptional regulator n=1 Tax=Kribbella italica TaxID=1540520 RepID=A0A7W9J4K5_9ACTN|nr:TetR/AcrR family transcriptional regulator [Kribbella italica]MBB5835511.1 AcrR family transcriptional regulator [Kribbella italica]